MNMSPDGGGGGGGWSPLKGSVAREAAAGLGFTHRIPPQKAQFDTHGQSLFYNPKTKTYISPDIDGHGGGVWKMFDKSGNRIGTYDANLNYIGP